MSGFYWGQGSCSGSFIKLCSKGTKCSYPFCTTGFELLYLGAFSCVFILVTGLGGQGNVHSHQGDFCPEGHRPERRLPGHNPKIGENQKWKFSFFHRK